MTCELSKSARPSDPGRTCGGGALYHARTPFGVAVLLVALCVAGGCEPDPHDLQWGFSFRTDDDQRRAVLIEGTIAEGGCDGPVLYRSMFEVSDGVAVQRPPALPVGRYGLYGRARGADCVWFVEGCLTVDLPSDQAVHIVALDTPTSSAECAPAECTDGLCTGESLDAGPPDSGVDAGPDDAGVIDGCVPAAETCDGTDEDCDRMIDEDFDLTSDDSNCGTCGTVCGGETSCVSGTCGCAAPTMLDPPDRCRDVTVDPENCGRVGTRCRDDQWCVDSSCECRPGLTDVGGACRDLQTDPRNCGVVGRDCSTMGSMVTCRGTCEDACSMGQTNCSNACVDVSNDPLNCGACGVVCQANRICRSGRCERYLVATSCSSCPCDADCVGEFERCRSYGPATICHQD